MDDTIDLDTTPIHLGLGGTAAPVEDFSWTPERLERYAAETADDGPDGRMVTMMEMAGTWDQWERHPAGAEVVVCCTGRHRFTQELDGEEQTVELTPGRAVVNPPGVWHTATTEEPGLVLFITPGRGTEHRPRET